MEVLNQLGQLVLGSVPTIVLFLILLGAYRVLMYGPLTRTLAERRERTEGAMAKAREAISAADEKSREYEEKLREARRQMLAAREQRVQQWNAEAEAALNVARRAARQQVESARHEIERSMTEAKRSIEPATVLLSQQIIKAIVPRPVVDPNRQMEQVGG